MRGHSFFLMGGSPDLKPCESPWTMGRGPWKVCCTRRRRGPRKGKGGESPGHACGHWSGSNQTGQTLVMHLPLYDDDLSLHCNCIGLVPPSRNVRCPHNAGHIERTAAANCCQLSSTCTRFNSPVTGRPVRSTCLPAQEP
jgi:hypothetical protein